MGAPADAIRELTRALETQNVAAAPKYVKDDIRNLRRAFPDDDEFSRAIAAVARSLGNIAAKSAGPLDRELNGWWRLKFKSGNSDDTDLRLIFRVVASEIELLAFGHRSEPDSIYFTAGRR